MKRSEAIFPSDVTLRMTYRSRALRVESRNKSHKETKRLTVSDFSQPAGFNVYNLSKFQSSNMISQADKDVDIPDNVEYLIKAYVTVNYLCLNG